MFNNVKVSYQNNGSNWLIILNGKDADIELVFNSLWNLRATSGELEWNGSGCAQFWTSPFPVGDSKNSLWGYFFNYHSLHSISYETDAKIKERAKKFVQKHGKRFSSSCDYRARVSRVYERMTRLLVTPKANKSFNDFKENHASDFRMSFKADAREFPEYSYGKHDVLEDEEAGNLILKA